MQVVRQIQQATLAGARRAQQNHQRRVMQDMVTRNNLLATEAMRRAVALAGSVEPALAVDTPTADPAADFLDRVRNLSPAQRRALVEKLGGLVVAVLATFEFLVRSKAIGAALVVCTVALALYSLLNAVEAIDDDLRDE